MTVEPAGKQGASRERPEVAQRLLDDMQGVLAIARQHPDMVKLIEILEGARDEAERVLKQALNPR